MAQSVPPSLNLIGVGALYNKTINKIVMECESCVGIEIRNNLQLTELTYDDHYIESGSRIFRFPLPNVTPITKNAILFESNEKGHGPSGMIVFLLKRLHLSYEGTIEHSSERVRFALAWAVRGEGYKNEIAIGFANQIPCNQLTFSTMMHELRQYWFKRGTARQSPIFCQNFSLNSHFQAMGRMSSGIKATITVDLY